jgi:hypothetical protein
MKKLVKKTVHVERTPLHGQEDISYWEEVEEQTDDKDLQGSFNQDKLKPPPEQI